MVLAFVYANAAVIPMDMVKREHIAIGVMYCHLQFPQFLGVGIADVFMQLPSK